MIITDLLVRNSILVPYHKSFDVAEERNPSESPVRWEVISGLEVNRANIGSVGALWLAVYWAFIECWILAARCVYSIQVYNGHGLVQHLGNG